MSEADRIARENVQRATRQAQDDRRHAADSERMELESTKSDIRNEIRLVLSLLAEAGYPNVEEVTITHSRRVLWWWRSTKERKGGWQIAANEVYFRGDPHMVPIYLISDGRLMYGQVEWDITTEDRLPLLKDALAGMRMLRRELEK